MNPSEPFRSAQGRPDARPMEALPEASAPLPVGDITGAWDRRRWIKVIGGLVLVQLVALVLIAERLERIPRRAQRPTTYRLTDPASPTSMLGASLIAADPTLFALVSSNGFSGPLWLDPPQITYRLREWSEPPQVTTQRLERLGADYTELIGAQLGQIAPNADRPAPRLSEVKETQTGPLVSQSTVRLEGDLVNRTWAGDFCLTSWPYAGLLSNTVVEVTVNGGGQVFSALLLNSCGLKGADQYALDFAWAARFKPLPLPPGVSEWAPEALDWGRLVFDWLTTDPGATNPPSLKP